jgi:hypothetical protein
VGPALALREPMCLFLTHPTHPTHPTHRDVSRSRLVAGDPVTRGAPTVLLALHLLLERLAASRAPEEAPGSFFQVRLPASVNRG